MTRNARRFSWAAARGMFAAALLTAVMLAVTQCAWRNGVSTPEKTETARPIPSAPEGGRPAVPDINRIVDTYVPIVSDERDAYIAQLRRDILPAIRSLQKAELLAWFAFLVHGARQLDGREPLDHRMYIHLRLQPAADIEMDAFIRKLPAHFLNPQPVTLGQMAGVDGSLLQDQDWAYAWKMLGEASQWVLSLIESHRQGPIPLQQIVQFMHFITNPLMLGHRFLLFPEGFISF